MARAGTGDSGRAASELPLPGSGPVPVWRSHRLLADGREIIYYDETPGLGRAGVADSRDLPPSQVPGTSGPGAAAGAESELRFDPLLGEWVIFAAQRQERTFLPAADHCPLCPSGPGRLTEIPAPGYDVVVFENRFPALRGSDSRPSQVPPHRAVSQHPAVSDPGVAGFGLAGSFGEAGALSARLPGYGRCEVICFTQEHDAPFASLSNRRAGTVLAAWADRTSVLGAIPGIEHVYCFENAGEEVGVTLSHPHGQIYALPFVPPLTRRLTASAHAYRARQGRNLFDDLVASELADGRRIVARNDHWVAFVPSAARWPFEVMLFPAARVADITGLDVAAQVAFCDIYLDVLRRFDALFGTPMPHVAAWQQAGVHDQAGRAEFAAHVQVLGVLRTAGRRKFVAGTEVGAQVWSNDVLPETAARMLRAAAR